MALHGDALSGKDTSNAFQGAFHSSRHYPPVSHVDVASVLSKGCARDLRRGC